MSDLTNTPRRDTWEKRGFYEQLGIKTACILRRPGAQPGASASSRLAALMDIEVMARELGLIGPEVPR